MIISASYRTAIPAYFGAWFTAGLKRRYVMVKNPYSGNDFRVSLAAEDVDGFVFWTRNVAPFLEQLDLLHATGRPFTIQYTVTGYPAALEIATPHWGRAVELIRVCANRYGRRSVVWRYDPIVMSDATDMMFHRRNFARIAGSLYSYVDEVVVSFMEPYLKTRRNMDIVAEAHGFSWRIPDHDEKSSLLADLTMFANYYKMKLTACTPPDLTVPGAKCIDIDRLSEVAGRELVAKQKGNRPGCFCAESRDIGAYDTCAQGCAYCYAVSNRSRAMIRLQNVKPDNESLES